MAITAKMVKELREMTGAGMMDCKKALTETDGDIEAAVEVLRKKGAAKAAKKAGRIAAEGLVRTYVSEDAKVASIVEVNSETDFVAKNGDFQAYVEAVTKQAAQTEAADMDAFMAEPWILDSANTVQEALVAKIAVIGENLKIRRFEKITTDGCVVSYIHAGGRIGVLVELAADAIDDGIKEAGENIAMQIAAMNPTHIKREDISADELAKLREITIDSAINDPASLPKPILNSLIQKAISTGAWEAEDVAIYEEKKSNMNYLFNFLSKPAIAALAEIGMADKEEIMGNKIFAGLVEGRISKQLKEITLLEQGYVKADDGKQTVKAYLASVNKTLAIKKFVRYEVGEGLEKKNEDFAAEVAAQMGM